MRRAAPSLLAACALAVTAWGAEAPSLVDKLATKIQTDQLPDGALRMSARNDNVRIVPYFSNLAAIALLETDDPQYRETVRRWIEWYAAHQEADGTIYDYVGKMPLYLSTGKRDSTDSYASTYLQLLWRYWQIAGREAFTPAMKVAAEKALDAIQLTIDPEDGLTWAKPEYKIKYLMDNLEVCIGLEEGAKLLTALGDPVQADQAFRLRGKIVVSLGEWWQSSQGYFAWAKGGGGKFHLGFDRWYPEGLIHLFAVSVLQTTPPGLWDKLKAQFGGDAKLTPDWWLRASKAAGTTEEQNQYAAATQKYAEQLVANGDLNRLATTLLALTADQHSTVELTVLSP